MIVRVTLSVEVDPGAWMELYGSGPGMTAHAIREDVRSYVGSSVRMSAAAYGGAIVRVEQR